MVQRTMTETSWGTMHALCEGEPDAGDVVVVPGPGASAYLRQSVATLARSGYRAWLVDPPGFGGSGDPAKAMGMPEVASSVTEWMDRHGLDQAVLVGHSSGTQVAARVATALPVTRLVLGSPTLDPAYRSWFRALRRWRLDGQHEPTALVRTALPEWRRAGPARMLRLVRSMLADDLEVTLWRVPCPIVVIRGELDPLCTVEWARRLAAGPDRHLVELPAVAHAFPYQRPHAFADVMTADRA